jgi:hypothetical protein
MRNTEAGVAKIHVVTVKAMPTSSNEKSRKETRKEKRRRKKLKRKQDALNEAKRREAASASLLTKEKYHSRPSPVTKLNETSSHHRDITPPNPMPVQATLSLQRSTTSIGPERAPHHRPEPFNIDRQINPRVLSAVTEFLHGLQHEQSQLCKQSSALDHMRHTLQSTKFKLEVKRIALVGQLFVLTGELGFDLGVAEYALAGDMDESRQWDGGVEKSLEECLEECKRAVKEMVRLYDDGVERLCKGLRRNDEVKRLMGF